MVVKKTIEDVSRGVICTWRFVCGERGRGIESCLGWSVGSAEATAASVGSGGGCVWDGASDDVDIMRGISMGEIHVLKFTLLKVMFNAFLSRHVVYSLQPYSPGRKRLASDTLSSLLRLSIVCSCQDFDSNMASRPEGSSSLSDPEERRVLFATLDSF